MIEGHQDARAATGSSKNAVNGDAAPASVQIVPPNDTARVGLGATIRPPSVVLVFLIAVLLLAAAYSLVFSLTIGEGIIWSAETALANVLPLAVLAAASYVILKYVVLRQGVVAQTLWHIALAPVFAITWYGMTLGALALAAGVRTGEVAIGSFSGIAFVWQMFQGIVLYALVAAISYALQGGRTTVPVRIVPSVASLTRYLTKQGDELVPVAVDDIVLIRGAQDYAEVVTADNRAHLVRMSLSQFEDRLPDDRFVRVHRSVIVNIAHLGRAEPIGSGRLALHLAGGQTVEASRAGAQSLRSLVL